jgi:hypothetical protein
MAIKAGQILHDVHGFVIDRIQTAGAGSVNIPEEKVYELGNFQTVATVRDIPDLSFDLESFDVSCEIEAILTNEDPTAIIAGQEFVFADHVPVDINSPFKAGTNEYNVVKGLSLPYLTLEKATYRYGLRQNATQSFTLRGDSIFYVPGTPYYQEYTNVGTGAYSFTNTAIEYVESGDSNYALCVTAVDSTTKAYKRLFLGTHYTNTSAGFTMLVDLSATYDTLRAVYGSATAATYSQAVHQGVSVKPAAVRGKDIDVYVGTSGATPVFSRWSSVQSAEVNWSVSLENDEEFGNKHYVSSDYDVADVTGTIGLKPSDPAELWERIAEIADVATNKIIGPYTSTTLPVEIRISDPDSGSVLKTLYVPDARFKVPGIQGRVQTKTEVSLEFTSDGGNLSVFNGER